MASDDLNLSKKSTYRYFQPDTELLSNFTEENEVFERSTTSSESSYDSDLTRDLVRLNPSSTSNLEFNRKNPNLVSRSYRFIQLERQLTAANLLKKSDDQLCFRQDYQQSLRENTFEKFLEKSYEQLEQHKEQLRRQRRRTNFQTLTFVNLEENFLALDPTSDIKIVFLDDLKRSSKLNYKTTTDSAQSNQSIDDVADRFYEKRSRRLLRDPSRARDEITLFARRAGERLQEHLPFLSRVPHRVKIVDEREIKTNYDQHTLHHMKHKQNLEIIHQRRQLVQQMIQQSRKNQEKMRKLNFQTPLATANSTHSTSIFNKINDLQQSSIRTFTASDSMTSSSSSSSYLSCSTCFRDLLIPSVRRQSNTRPQTAPMKSIR